MEYELEELLPAAACLTEKYTSKESSSVTYETARMLMEAVIYCIRECEKDFGAALRPQRGLSAMEAYEIGYEKILKKARSAKAVYDRVAQEFEDYGCSNYRDTIMRGMPEFFLYYDARFCPQDHILTLDYPTMCCHGDQTGIDLIFTYLCNAETEKSFLDCFETNSVKKLIKNAENSYCGEDITFGVHQRSGSYYMGNICSLVLLQAVGCMVSKGKLSDLELTREDVEVIQRYFQGSSMEVMEGKIQTIIGFMADQAGLAQKREYFQTAAHEYASQIYNAIENQVLDILFLNQTI
ncbi:DUF6179 domain-containing protein [Anaerostipes sp.]|uniref:DUF6179 domain-containing protein n=1 Tax=Anaerostipes sp. TaxID=1872530 RepID=UPI0025BCE8D2|nr:DUF6179 domain-containing protein [Anaerostipes sp.]MBS7009900.1 hypothetical protein [Anaerostipes sp.]